MNERKISHGLGGYSATDRGRRQVHHFSSSRTNGQAAKDPAGATLNNKFEQVLIWLDHGGIVIRDKRYSFRYYIYLMTRRHGLRLGPSCYSDRRLGVQTTRDPMRLEHGFLTEDSRNRHPSLRVGCAVEQHDTVDVAYREDRRDFRLHLGVDL